MKKLFLILCITASLSARIWREMSDGVEILRYSGDILMDGGLEEQIAFHNDYEKLLKQKGVEEWHWEKGNLVPIRKSTKK